MTEIATAMVMAAGLGKRMRPLTATAPKPLIKVAGKPLIDHCLDRLAAADMTRVIVNVHYLADALEAHLRAAAYPFEIAVSDERALLMETGGGMIQARPMIGTSPFFCLNSDNIWVDGTESVFAALRHVWDGERMDALLLVVPHARAANYRGPGDFHLDQHGRVSRRRPGRVAPFIYTGIQIVSDALLVDPPAGPFSTNILWDRAIARGRLFGLAHQGLWFDVGSPAAIAPTADALTHG